MYLLLLSLCKEEIVKQVVIEVLNEERDERKELELIEDSIEIYKLLKIITNN